MSEDVGTADQRESRLEIPLDHCPEEVQGEHIEKQVSPTAVDKTVAQHPVPLLPVPDIIGVELQRIHIEHTLETEDAYSSSE